MASEEKDLDTKESSAENDAAASLDELEHAATGEGGGKKKKLIIIGAVLALLILGGSGFFLMKMLKKGAAPSAEHTAEGEHGEASGEASGETPPELDEHGQPIVTGPVYYEMDEFLVNLNTGGKQVKFLKMKIILELPNPKAVPAVEDNINRIRDSFQVYLRELRSEDLQGSGGIYRLREELLLRINKLIYPTQLNNILFKDILVQ